MNDIKRPQERLPKCERKFNLSAITFERKEISKFCISRSASYDATFTMKKKKDFPGVVITLLLEKPDFKRRVTTTPVLKNVPLFFLHCEGGII